MAKFFDVPQEGESKHGMMPSLYFAHYFRELVSRFDSEFRYTFVNKAAERVTGLAADALLGKTLAELGMSPDLVAFWEQAIEGVFSTGMEAQTSFSFEAQSGRRHYAWILTPEKDASGIVQAVLSVAYDTTELNRLRNHAFNFTQLAQFKAIVESSDDAIISKSLEGIVTSWNRGAEVIFGYTAAEMIGRPLLAIFPPERQHEEAIILGRLIAGETVDHFETVRVRKDGRLVNVSATISPIRDEYGNIVGASKIARDISQLKAHEAELDHVAHYDPLTGLPNRRLLGERLDSAILRSAREGKSLAVCYLDLDGFKVINDSFGHSVGDQVLCSVAAELQKVVRDDDTLARLGGDEFVVLVSNIDSPQACTLILHRMMAAIKQPSYVEGTLVTLSTSIGVALYPEDTSDADTLLRHADQAMYIAKEAGKNCFHMYDAENDRRTHGYKKILTRLQLALENHEFVLHYQPQVDLTTGALVGLEALIRWQDPERGLIPPGEFLPYVYGSNLESALGYWVLDHVMEQAEQMMFTSLSVPVSVNISADHLMDTSFVANLSNLLLNHSKLPRGHLKIEILETAALGDLLRGIEVIKQCCALGVQFALDDFGTGYSSLTYLRRLPVSTLKIDQSFVRDMLHDEEDLSIVEGVIHMARAFKRDVIAEGVETMEHGLALVRLGCSIAQGYGIARPMPASELAPWLQAWGLKKKWIRK